VGHVAEMVEPLEIALRPLLAAREDRLRRIVIFVGRTRGRLGPGGGPGGMRSGPVGGRRDKQAGRQQGKACRRQQSARIGQPAVNPSSPPEASAARGDYLPLGEAKSSPAVAQ
jgi:hypothetical protein